jgi:SAM-dependent methyltransferase
VTVGVDVAGALARRLPPPLIAWFDRAFVESSLRYEEYVFRLALEVLHQAEIAPALARPGTAAEIAARAGLDPSRSAVPVAWMLRYVGARGAVAVDAGPGAPRFSACGPVPRLDPAPIRTQQEAADPAWLPSYALAELVAREYPAFLRGQVTGEEILFTPSRFRLWGEYFANSNALYAVNNRVGAVAVEQWMPAGPGTILELGGGLASAALALLERLEGAGRLGRIREYRFTELVPAFLRRGQGVLESRFAGADFLRFQPLDMNRPFAAQGIAEGSVSTVYAVNTLHVARDLGATLREIQRALRPGGQLIASECVRPRPGQAIYVEFVFNLMETFRAPRLAPPHRPNGGFLTPEQWAGLLEEAGFRDVRFLPDIVALRDEFPTFYVAALGARRP